MDLHIGTSGFSFPSWRAQVYPHTLKANQMFDYYCRNFGFDSVELNASFYNMPSAASMNTLARRSPENFGFMVKLFNAFTHNRHQLRTDTIARFRTAVAPMISAAKLRGVLAQFPADFLPTRANADWLCRLRDTFAPVPLFVEFRHRAWDDPRIFPYLARQNIGYCMTDLPQLGNLPRFIPKITNGTAYVRMHGRNQQWYQPATSRYDYAYSDAELRNLLSRLRKLDRDDTRKECAAIWSAVASHRFTSPELAQGSKPPVEQAPPGQSGSKLPHSKENRLLFGSSPAGTIDTSPKHGNSELALSSLRLEIAEAHAGLATYGHPPAYSSPSSPSLLTAFVFFNNCHGAGAVRSALRMRALFSESS
jgi:uncharacterized protein YecE (DUF72 family)